MFIGLESMIRSAGRWLSPATWLTKIMHLPVSEEGDAERGLIMIQVDGLARRQFEKALDKNRMPFVKSLIDSGESRLYSMYSGQPASTPGVQGETMYGVKGIVPAFDFYDREEEREFRMYDSECAKTIESRLQQKAESLLKGGSGYSNIYAEGAAEAHFSAAEMGPADIIRSQSFFKQVLYVLFNIPIIFRIVALMLVEVGLGLFDFFKGALKGQSFRMELMFVPSRVAICILLRELVVLGVSMDAARGLPIIYANFLGYDEQSHRRGPSSAFAHWVLEGIDHSIRRIAKSARQSRYRDYDIVVFSDHGQEAVQSFGFAEGRSVEDAVKEALGYAHGPEPGKSKTGVRQIRHNLLKSGLLRKILPAKEEEDSKEEPIVTAMGPLGHVYLHEKPKGFDEQDAMANKLVHDAGIPLVMAVTKDSEIYAWNRHGRYRLPEEIGSILGSDHPFLEELRDDLPAICTHVNAGDFVISGWQMDRLPLSFPLENGAHAGPGPEETHAFVVLPTDMKTPNLSEQGYLRPKDLRQSALIALGREADESAEAMMDDEEASDRRHLRILTYNIHSCVGADGKSSPARIAQIIAHEKPDIVALQEVDVGRERTYHSHQAKKIAHYLQMDYQFHAIIELVEEKYGDAILSRLPMSLIRKGKLPGARPDSKSEPRGAIWVEVRLGGHRFQIINTHLGLSARERINQARELEEEWIKPASKHGPVILCGDMNAGPRSKVCGIFGETLRDVAADEPNRKIHRTFPMRMPMGQIDHFFIDPTRQVRHMKCVRSRQSLVASDHLPLVADTTFETGDLQIHKVQDQPRTRDADPQALSHAENLSGERVG
ncbi:MAG: endonuclease/exonuclease/phosphatase family protein [Candidatus Sumerlaeota bacterium]